MSDNPHWMEDAAARMKRKGTVGAFGKATPGKIAAAKREGGVEEKRAVFAQNATRAAKRRSNGKR